jgi:hypothetical protein
MNRFVSRPDRRTRSYVLQDDVIARVDRLAQKHGVYQSSVVNLLLKRALAEVESGRWPLTAKPVSYDATWDD